MVKLKPYNLHNRPFGTELPYKTLLISKRALLHNLSYAKKSFTHKFIVLYIKLISIQKVVHQACFETEVKGQSEMVY